MPTGSPLDIALAPVAPAYVDRAAQVLNLPLQPDHRPGVIENFDRMVTIAQLVLNFPLPNTVEVAPVFHP